MQLLREVLPVVPQPGDTRARAHGGAAVQLRPVREALHTVGTSENASERPHGRAAVRLRALREEVRREAEPEDPPAETPPATAGHHRECVTGGGLDSGPAGLVGLSVVAFRICY